MTLSYDDAIDYLYSLINYEIQRPERYAPDVISLERPRRLMAELGDPQTRYPAIHLTGTKGKGSVSAYCASVLQAAGYRVGLYSSPHLQDFRERFRVNGALIEPERLADLIERVRPVIERVPGLTWFEVVTALAFLYFAEAQVDLAVIEVGLGGRLDATNVLEKPLVSAITSLSYDHMYLLGNTLAEIASEKAGIIKPGVPVVSAPQEPEALDVLERVAGERQAPLTLVGRDLHVEVGQMDEFGQHFSVKRTLSDPPAQAYWTPLIGAHQAVNATVALATLQHVQAAGFALPERTLHVGLRLVNWPGRLEVVRRHPWLVLDAAHNGASAARLRETLQAVFLAQHAHSRLILVFGAFKDKDVPAMFRALLPITAELILMQAMNLRAFSPEQLADLAREAGYTRPIHLAGSAPQALAEAEGLVGPADVICATGSLSVVGEMRTILGLAPARAVYLDELAVQTIQNAL